MNCDEYREMISADPAFDGGAAHLSACSECQAFRSDMQSLNLKIAKAMQINVPEPVLPELPAVATANVVPIATRKTFPKRAWFAMAATMLLAVLVGVLMFDGGAQYDSLAEEVVAHLDHEPAALRVSTTPVSSARLARAVPADVASLDHSAGLITYARSCEINGKTVPHLVIQGEHGPVTILLMPDEALAEAVPLDGENIHGVIVPVGAGSIAIIGAREERLERIENNVLNSVNWST
ncbi:MAG: DUF3379 domain-containing protein [Gammaproteobacteria bacterium]|nr:DUF3379 domain-containing protein [Gammaproteobacteria bacterium]MBT8109583.1 DUF3379 domain-containing protein [Gammaproteobacteria bacterium]NND47258.1 DUF3379 family protein [Woeseiaceae bacterium]NNL44285.1 DUF3379 family protein [Woeseiaceae bacterium]